MERNIQKTGLINLFVMLTVATVGTVIARSTNSLSDEAGVVFLWLGVLVTAISYFQARLEAREELEKLELEELARSANRTTLFETAAADTFLARRTREQFERWVVPLFTFLIFALQAGAAWWLWNFVLTTVRPAASPYLVTFASLFALSFFILFLLGKYSAGIARMEGQRLLRPGASYMLLGAYLCVLSALSIAAVKYGHPKVDDYVARALCGILTLTAVETLINLVLEIYRPRVKGRAARLLYESRLIGLLGQPEGLVTTAAQALDYQFGFKVSETWFYRFVERAAAWLILVQLGALLLSSCFVFVEHDEQALLERCGEPVVGREVLDPGFHLKLPWPVDQVYRYKSGQIQNFNVGFIPDPTRTNETTTVWTVSHTKEEFNLMVASRDPEAGTTNASSSVPVNLLSVSVPVQFRITNVVDWARNNADPAALLEIIATREVVRYLVSVDLFDIMSAGKEAAAETLRERIQGTANELNLGVTVLFVGLRDIHPPIGNENSKVAEAFESVVGALQEKEAKILAAEGHSIRTNALATAEATRIRLESESYKLLRTSSAQALATNYVDQIKAFEAAPTVYPRRLYLLTLAKAAAGSRKYILGTANSSEVIQFNLEDKIRQDILDIPVPPQPKK